MSNKSVIWVFQYSGFYHRYRQLLSGYSMFVHIGMLSEPRD